MSHVMVPVTRIAKLCNPLISDGPWETAATAIDVERALKENRLASASGNDHAARIAYFVVHPSDDPIEIDVGVPSVGYGPLWPVTDGNHRLAAAIYSDRAEIAASISGDVKLIEELFGAECV